ncbi:MAG: ATP-binding protein [Candidatus Margulisiibacteriota bacterium]
MLKKWLFTVFGALGCFIILVGIISVLKLPLPEPAIEGYAIRAQQWNNYGINISLGRFSTQTNVNGYFAFYNILPCDYILTVKGVSPAIIRYKGPKITLPAINLPSVPRQIKQSFILHLFSFLVGLIVLGFGFIVFHKLKNRQMAAIFLVMTGAPATINIISFIQFIVAYYFDEIVGAGFFPIAYSVFLVLGPAFFRFFLLFPYKHKWADRVLPIIYFPSILLLFVILSWMAFGNDYHFAYFWGVSYIQVMLIVMVMNSIFCLGGLLLLVRSISKVKEQLQKQKLKVMLAGISFGAGFFFVFLAIPVIFYEWFTPFPGYYNLFASITGLIIFGVFCYTILKQKLIDIGRILSSGLTYFLTTSIIIVIYGLTIVLSENVLRQYISNVWVLGAVFVGLAYLFTPLKNSLQRVADRLFGRDPHLYKHALQGLARRLAEYTDIDQLEQAVRETITGAMKVKDVQMVLTDNNCAEKDYNACLTLEMQTSQGVVGCLLLSERSGGQEYDTEDYELLKAIAGQAAIAIRNAQLYQELAQANQRQLEAQKQADRSSRLASLGTIAAGLAHEIKNPLSALNTMTKLVQTRIDDPEFRQELIDIVPRQVERMNGLIKSLLAFAKPQEPFFEAVNLTVVIEEVIKLTSAKLRKHNIKVKYELTDDIHITGDEQQLVQVVLNIVLNAIDAMPSCGDLQIRTSKDIDKCILTIRDTGIGIGQESMENIFNPFYTTKQEGTGLGLSTTWRILKEHNAEIKVDSKLGEGTAFTIYFTR